MHGRLLRLWPAVVLTAAMALGACGKSEPQPGTPAPAPAASPAAPQAAEQIPLLQLPRTVVPTHYRLELTILPESARFTGHAEIDVTFKEPRTSMYLHGRDLTVHSAKLVPAGGTAIAAHYEQVDPTGVVRLTFDKQVPAGEAKLVFDYDAAYHAALEGLYKVVDRGDSYVFSQFENIDARRAFPSSTSPASRRRST